MFTPHSCLPHSAVYSPSITRRKETTSISATIEVHFSHVSVERLRNVLVLTPQSVLTVVIR